MLPNKKKILESIINKKEEQLLSIGTVVTVDPLTIKFPPDTTAIPAVPTTSLHNLRENSRVLCLRYGKQFLVISVLGNINLGSCILETTGTWTISTGSTTTLGFSGSTEVYDPLGMHDGTTNTSRITIPSDGIYLVSASGRWADSTDGSGRIVYIAVNGSTINAVAGSYDTSGRSGQNNNLILQLEEDDYVEMAVYQSSGGDLDFGGSGFRKVHFAVSPLLGGTTPGVTGGSTSTQPPGSITQYAGSSAPSGWLLCDGSAVSRTTYSDLFGIISTTYGVGDGSTTFNLPDMQGKIPVGLDSGDGDFDALGETGGAKTHTLTSDEMPSHTHTQNSHTHTQNSHNHTQDSHTHGVRYKTLTAIDGGYICLRRRDASDSYDGEDSDAAGSTTATNQATTATNQNTTATNQNTGGGSSHNNLQPYITLNYIIKT